MSVRVKICGITNLADAWTAIEAGADALGFVFCASSPRCVALSEMADMIAELPPFVTKVGLFVNAPETLIQQAIGSGIDAVQLHGDEPPDFCQKFAPRVVKAFRLQNEASLEQLLAYQHEAWLLDSYVAGKSGGTGERFNWEWACRATQLSRRVILAGGLTPANVEDAVRFVRPYGVDVSSGVESRPGRKDPVKVREFIQAAKQAAN